MEDKKELEDHEKIPPKDSQKKKGSDKALVYVIIFLIVIVILFFIGVNILKKPDVKTVDDLNNLNIEGKLDSEDGYLYNNVYSFIKLGGLWYTQLNAPSGNAEYNIPFHFGPREVEDLRIFGKLDETFTDAEEVYITFNPLGNDLTHVALAVGEFDQSLITAFGKKPIAACDKNETEACKIRPIVTCKDEDKAVVYFKELPETKVTLNGNCIIFQGTGLEIVRAVDRLLLKWYGVME